MIRGTLSASYLAIDLCSACMYAEAVDEDFTTQFAQHGTLPTFSTQGIKVI